MIRFAFPSDGVAIKALMIESRWMSAAVADKLNWTTVDQNWLVAEVDGKLQGAIQVYFGTPVARLESLVVDQSLDGMVKARLVRDLGAAAIALCKQLGAGAVRAFVPFNHANIKKNYKKRGWQVMNQGNMLLKVLE